MKTLYFDCSMGAAGDMLTAALLELHPHPDEAVAVLNEAFAGRALLSFCKDSKCGIQGTHVTVKIGDRVEGVFPSEEPDRHHPHTSLQQIQDFISSLPLPAPVIANALQVYALLAEAESCVHGQTIENIHFHEVGTLDAMADVVSVCYLIHELDVDQILASPVHVGSGTVHCAHGILSVPAPATQKLLQGIPIYSSDVLGELCTPTGAALLKHYVQQFGPMPILCVTRSGIGTGSNDFSRANLLRVLLSEENEREEEILELVCNLDDMSPEDLGFVQEKLFSLGALDVYTTNIGMKKCRPGVMLTCMCWEKSRRDMLSCLFQNTSTLGVREYVCRRYGLNHRVCSMQTSYGPVRVKRAEGWGAQREKYEYEDLRRIALKYEMSLSSVRESLTENRKD